MTVVPLHLAPGARVLVVGAGGGFDFLCGLPIALELEERGHPTFIASYSFTHLQAVRGGIWRTPGLIEVTPASACDDDYFPERHLAAWFADVVGVERPIWCLGKGAVAETRESLDHLVRQHGIDAVVCVDGGVDGIFRGDEADLGTPSMDSVTVLATHTCAAAHRLYACTAFGVEGAEGTVSHAQALERMAELTAQGAFRGVGAIVPTDPVGRRFVDAASYEDGAREPVSARGDSLLHSRARMSRGSYQRGRAVQARQPGARPTRGRVGQLFTRGGGNRPNGSPTERAGGISHERCAFR